MLLYPAQHLQPLHVPLVNCCYCCSKRIELRVPPGSTAGPASSRQQAGRTVMGSGKAPENDVIILQAQEGSPASRGTLWWPAAGSWAPSPWRRTRAPSSGRWGPHGVTPGARAASGTRGPSRSRRCSGCVPGEVCARWSPRGSGCRRPALGSWRRAGSPPGYRATRRRRLGKAPDLQRQGEH